MDKVNSPLQKLDDQEESVRIAVRALDDMRNRSIRAESSRLAIPSSSEPSASASAMYSPAHSPTSPKTRNSSTDPAVTSAAFVSRMTSLPLLGSALRVYEHGKASSRVVKYGAEMVESSVKTLSRPVIDRLPMNVNQLDEFACRQLDRLDRYRRPSSGEASTSNLSTGSSYTERGRSGSKALEGSALDDSPSVGRSPSRSSETEARSRRRWREGGERATNAIARPPNTTITQTGDPPPESDTEPPNDQQVAQRSRWQAVLLEAGGLSAALSEDSMRRLKYCLHWLQTDAGCPVIPQYATAHIDAQILILREFAASMQEYPPDAPPHARRPNPISEEHLRKLAEVRRDVVQTVRQVVDVVSKYTGGALPEPARSTVRGFILKLPQRWASKAGVGSAGAGSAALATGSGSQSGERESVAAAAGSGSGVAHRRNGRRAAHRERGAGAEGSAGLRSGQSSRAASPSSPRVPRGLALTPLQTDGAAPQQQISHNAAMLAAQRILSLATESLDMMRGVTGVVKDSLDKAEAWVSRLRAVGINRGAQQGGEEAGDGGETDFESGYPLGSEYRHHRRNSSSISEDFPSPFFSGSSSTAWNSSIPSTPGGPYTPSSYPANVNSPGSVLPILPLSQMSLSSRYSTPKSVNAELPEEAGEPEGLKGGNGEAMRGMEKSGEVGDVKVVGVDAEVDEDGQRMDVDDR
ncbi:Opi1-domain-containing protein [Coprinopsis marcescibilis]|uniref:Opi1-domain-containing protein n=1 Tax=Coprinopsis marcescibilis TaxID=230819 RepID=A0A5C3KTY9_COPMA|nr:Opi1-domain-containing protein [Coprinopsis marcescibilis]